MPMDPPGRIPQRPPLGPVYRDDKTRPNLDLLSVILGDQLAVGDQVLIVGPDPLQSLDQIAPTIATMQKLQDANHIAEFEVHKPLSGKRTAVNYVGDLERKHFPLGEKPAPE